MRFTKVVTFDDVGEDVIESVEGWYPGGKVTSLVSPNGELVENGNDIIVVGRVGDFVYHSGDIARLGLSAGPRVGGEAKRWDQDVMPLLLTRHDDQESCLQRERTSTPFRFPRFKLDLQVTQVSLRVS